jgi:hypothetical protein
MIIKDPDNRVFICKDGELITVTVLSKKTAHLVTYRLDEETGHLDQGETLTFELDQSQADPSVLSLGFHFSSASGGAYAVEITGDPGEDTFRDIYRQDHVPVLFDHFTFDLWP